MITQHQESLSLPEFEDRLWDELSQLHGSEPGANKPQQRSPRRRYLVAAATVALAGLGAAVAAVVTADRPADLTTSPADAGEAPPPPDAIIVEEHRQDGNVTSRIWFDEATGSSRRIDFSANGDPDIEQSSTAPVEEPDGTLAVQGKTVDHKQHEYFEDEESHSPDGCPADFGPATAHEGPSCIDPPGSYRQDNLIRAQVENGDLVEDGFETVDGQELLRLAMAHDHEPIPGGDRVFLVDPETYRPVKETRAVPDEGSPVTVTYEYLERTSENLELLEVKIPSDYTPYQPG